jgi:hypothetical protein
MVAIAFGQGLHAGDVGLRLGVGSPPFRSTTMGNGGRIYFERSK